jgi:DNA helicase IV
VTRVAGLPLVEHRQPLEPGSLAHATISAFKGLEADVVVLLDLDPEDPRSSREARYVAATRARHRLYVIGATDWTR